MPRRSIHSGTDGEYACMHVHVHVAPPQLLTFRALDPRSSRQYSLALVSDLDQAAHIPDEEKAAISRNI